MLRHIVLMLALYVQLLWFSIFQGSTAIRSPRNQYSMSVGLHATTNSHAYISDTASISSRYTDNGENTVIVIKSTPNFYLSTCKVSAICMDRDR
ncbi:hypothetical protein C8Q75DRAFT_491186 [Abortiporus biennis]|nr:hypothetical protein C8Q75DRAFT_491186 [Abortiporus biennis]